jgi:hypothetical protein
VALRPRLATGVLFRGPSVIPDGAVASLALRGRLHKMDLVGMTHSTRAREPVHRYYPGKRAACEMGGIAVDSGRVMVSSQ